VANDGAHRIFAARLAGVPLRCRWKRCAAPAPADLAGPAPRGPGG